MSEERTQIRHHSKHDDAEITDADGILEKEEANKVLQQANWILQQRKYPDHYANLLQGYIETILCQYVEKKLDYYEMTPDERKELFSDSSFPPPTSSCISPLFTSIVQERFPILLTPTRILGIYGPPILRINKSYRDKYFVDLNRLIKINEDSELTILTPHDIKQGLKAISEIPRKIDISKDIVKVLKRILEARRRSLFPKFLKDMLLTAQRGIAGLMLFQFYGGYDEQTNTYVLRYKDLMQYATVEDLNQFRARLTLLEKFLNTFDTVINNFLECQCRLKEIKDNDSFFSFNPDSERFIAEINTETRKKGYTIDIGYSDLFEDKFFEALALSVFDESQVGFGNFKKGYKNLVEVSETAAQVSKTFRTGKERKELQKAEQDFKELEKHLPTEDYQEALKQAEESKQDPSTSPIQAIKDLKQKLLRELLQKRLDVFKWFISEIISNKNKGNLLNKLHNNTFNDKFRRLFDSRGKNITIQELTDFQLPSNLTSEELIEKIQLLNHIMRYAVHLHLAMTLKETIFTNLQSDETSHLEQALQTFFSKHFLYIEMIADKEDGPTLQTNHDVSIPEFTEEAFKRKLELFNKIVEHIALANRIKKTIELIIERYGRKKRENFPTDLADSFIAEKLRDKKGWLITEWTKKQGDTTTVDFPTLITVFSTQELEKLVNKVENVFVSLIYCLGFYKPFELYRKHYSAFQIALSKEDLSEFNSKLEKELIDIGFFTAPPNPSDINNAFYRNIAKSLYNNLLPIEELSLEDLNTLMEEYAKHAKKYTPTELTKDQNKRLKNAIKEFETLKDYLPQDEYETKSQQVLALQQPPNEPEDYIQAIHDLTKTTFRELLQSRLTVFRHFYDSHVENNKTFGPDSFRDLYNLFLDITGKQLLQGQKIPSEQNCPFKENLDIKTLTYAIRRLNSIMKWHIAFMIVGEMKEKLNQLKMHEIILLMSTVQTEFSFLTDRRELDDIYDEVEWNRYFFPIRPRHNCVIPKFTQEYIQPRLDTIYKKINNIVIVRQIVKEIINTLRLYRQHYQDYTEHKVVGQFLLHNLSDGNNTNGWLHYAKETIFSSEVEVLQVATKKLISHSSKKLLEIKDDVSTLCAKLNTYREILIKLKKCKENYSITQTIKDNDDKIAVISKLQEIVQVIEIESVDDFRKIDTNELIQNMYDNPEKYKDLEEKLDAAIEISEIFKSKYVPIELTKPQKKEIEKTIKEFNQLEDYLPATQWKTKQEELSQINDPTKDPAERVKAIHELTKTTFRELLESRLTIFKGYYEQHTDICSGDRFVSKLRNLIKELTGFQIHEKTPNSSSLQIKKQLEVKQLTGCLRQLNSLMKEFLLHRVQDLINKSELKSYLHNQLDLINVLNNCLTQEFPFLQMSIDSDDKLYERTFCIKVLPKKVIENWSTEHFKGCTEELQNLLNKIAVIKKIGREYVRLQRITTGEYGVKSFSDLSYLISMLNSLSSGFNITRESGNLFLDHPAFLKHTASELKIKTVLSKFTDIIDNWERYYKICSLLWSFKHSFGFIRNIASNEEQASIITKMSAIFKLLGFSEIDLDQIDKPFYSSLPEKMFEDYNDKEKIGQFKPEFANFYDDLHAILSETHKLAGTCLKRLVTEFIPKVLPCDEFRKNNFAQDMCRRFQNEYYYFRFKHHSEFSSEAIAIIHGKSIDKPEQISTFYSLQNDFDLAIYYFVTAVSERLTIDPAVTKISSEIKKFINKYPCFCRKEFLDTGRPGPQIEEIEKNKSFLLFNFNSMLADCLRIVAMINFGHDLLLLDQCTAKDEGNILAIQTYEADLSITITEHIQKAIEKICEVRKVVETGYDSITEEDDETVIKKKHDNLCELLKSAKESNETINTFKNRIETNLKLIDEIKAQLEKTQKEKNEYRKLEQAEHGGSKLDNVSLPGNQAATKLGQIFKRLNAKKIDEEIGLDTNASLEELKKKFDDEKLEKELSQVSGLFKDHIQWLDEEKTHLLKKNAEHNKAVAKLQTELQKQVTQFNEKLKLLLNAIPAEHRADPIAYIRSIPNVALTDQLNIALAPKEEEQVAEEDEQNASMKLNALVLSVLLQQAGHDKVALNSKIQLVTKAVEFIKKNKKTIEQHIKGKKKETEDTIKQSTNLSTAVSKLAKAIGELKIKTTEIDEDTLKALQTVTDKDKSVNLPSYIAQINIGQKIGLVEKEDLLALEPNAIEINADKLKTVSSKELEERVKSINHATTLVNKLKTKTTHYAAQQKKSKEQAEQRREALVKQIGQSVETLNQNLNTLNNTASIAQTTQVSTLTQAVREAINKEENGLRSELNPKPAASPEKEEQLPYSKLTIGDDLLSLNESGLTKLKETIETCKTKVKEANKAILAADKALQEQKQKEELEREQREVEANLKQSCKEQFDATKQQIQKTITTLLNTNPQRQALANTLAQLELTMPDDINYATLESLQTLLRKSEDLKASAEQAVTKQKEAEQLKREQEEQERKQKEEEAKRKAEEERRKQEELEKQHQREQEEQERKQKQLEKDKKVYQKVVNALPTLVKNVSRNLYRLAGNDASLPTKALQEKIINAKKLASGQVPNNWFTVVNLNNEKFDPENANFDRESLTTLQKLVTELGTEIASAELVIKSTITENMRVVDQSYQNTLALLEDVDKESVKVYRRIKQQLDLLASHVREMATAVTLIAVETKKAQFVQLEKVTIKVKELMSEIEILEKDIIDLESQGDVVGDPEKFKEKWEEFRERKQKLTVEFEQEEGETEKEPYAEIEAFISDLKQFKVDITPTASGEEELSESSDGEKEEEEISTTAVIAETKETIPEEIIVEIKTQTPEVKTVVVDETTDEENEEEEPDKESEVSTSDDSDPESEYETESEAEPEEERDKETEEVKAETLMPETTPSDKPTIPVAKQSLIAKLIQRRKPITKSKAIPQPKPKTKKKKEKPASKTSTTTIQQKLFTREKRKVEPIYDEFVRLQQQCVADITSLLITTTTKQSYLTRLMQSLFAKLMGRHKPIATSETNDVEILQLKERYQSLEFYPLLIQAVSNAKSADELKDEINAFVDASDKNDNWYSGLHQMKVKLDKNKSNSDLAMIKDQLLRDIYNLSPLDLIEPISQSVLSIGSLKSVTKYDHLFSREMGSLLASVDKDSPTGNVIHESLSLVREIILASIIKTDLFGLVELAQNNPAIANDVSFASDKMRSGDYITAKKYVITAVFKHYREILLQQEYAQGDTRKVIENWFGLSERYLSAIRPSAPISRKTKPQTKSTQTKKAEPQKTSQTPTQARTDSSTQSSKAPVSKRDQLEKLRLQRLQLQAKQHAGIWSNKDRNGTFFSNCRKEAEQLDAETAKIIESGRVL